MSNPTWGNGRRGPIEAERPSKLKKYGHNGLDYNFTRGGGQYVLHKMEKGLFF